MKYMFVCWSLFFCAVTQVFAQPGASESIVLSGVYQGSDIYVQNPFSGQGVSFCVFEVRINDRVTSDEVNSSAFVIDMEVMGINVGQEVEVIINHKTGCAPRVLNPEVLYPRSTFEIQDISVSNSGLLEWSTTNEAGPLPFIVEQFKWNKWVRVGEVPGEGKPGGHQYQFQLEPHSGLNVTRVRQTDFRNVPRISETTEFQGATAAITFSPERPRDQIEFSQATHFEIFDEYGNLVRRGFGKTVDVASLERGSYYLNYDRSFGETFRKR